MVRLTFIFYLMSIFCIPIALAEDGATHAGIVFGLSVPDADNTDPHQLVGVKGATSIFPNWGVGGYYFTTGVPVGSGGRKFHYTLPGIEVSFAIPIAGGEPYMSARAGMSKIRTMENGLDVIYSPNHYGIAVGYNYFLTDWLSLGFEGSYMHILKSNTTPASGGPQYFLPAFNVINFLMALEIRL
jgi:hypothetical protein